MTRQQRRPAFMFSAALRGEWHYRLLVLILPGLMRSLHWFLHRPYFAYMSVPKFKLSKSSELNHCEPARPLIMNPLSTVVAFVAITIYLVHIIHVVSRACQNQRKNDSQLHAHTPSRSATGVASSFSAPTISYPDAVPRRVPVSLLTATAMSTATASAPPLTFLDIPYFVGEGACDDKHRLDIYIPAGPFPRPRSRTCIFVHGG